MFYLTYLTVPTKSTGSCGIIANLDLRSSRPIVVISILSMYIVPDVGSTSRNKATPNDDFPVKQ